MQRPAPISPVHSLIVILATASRMGRSPAAAPPLERTEAAGSRSRPPVSDNGGSRKESRCRDRPLSSWPP
jgi:hypothetical protein